MFYENIDLIQQNIFKSMNFEIKTKQKIKGISGLDYDIPGIAFNEQLKHFVLLIKSNFFGKSIMKDFLLTNLDVGAKFKESGFTFSSVLFSSNYEIKYNKRTFKKQEHNFNKLDELKDLCYKNKGFIKYNHVINGKLDINPVFITKDQVFTFGKESCFTLSGVDYQSEKQQTLNFIKNNGGFQFDITMFAPSEIKLILNANDSNGFEMVKNITKTRGIYDFFFPPIDKFLIGIIKKGHLKSEKEIEKAINLAKEIGHLVSFNIKSDNKKTNLEEVLAILNNQKRIEFKVEYCLSKKGEEEYKIHIAKKPIENLIYKLIERFSIKIDFSIKDILNLFWDK